VKKINPIPCSENFTVATPNAQDDLLLKNDFLKFSRYSDCVLQVRWQMWNLLA